jgi:hypothetical protein
VQALTINGETNVGLSRSLSHEIVQRVVVGPRNHCRHTNTSKTMVAYALTIIGPVIQHDLNLIRNVRNQLHTHGSSGSRKSLTYAITSNSPIFQV